MVKITSWRELQVWQKAHSLTLTVYKITSKFPQHERYGLTAQARRAIVSVPSNIVEGFKRWSARDSINFYNVAAGSLEEVRYQLFLARDLSYISTKDFDDFSLLADEVAKMLYAWIKSQRAHTKVR